MDTLRIPVILLFLARGVSPAQALSGDWGGEHVSLQVTAAGGTVEFDCAHGDITGRVLLDRRARFDVPGTYVEEHGGPARMGEPARSLRVRYAGRVTNGRMTLTVTRTDTKARLGSFTLERGREPTLMKCR